MVKFNHMALPVSNPRVSRDWYVKNFGFEVEFDKPPGKYFWGYGAELSDPDGYLVNLWDEVSMREKGAG